MPSIEQISLLPTQDEHREALDWVNAHTSEELLKDMEYRRIGGIAIAVARPFNGPSLDETLEQGDAPIVRFLPWGNNAIDGDFNQSVQTQVLSNISGRPIIAMSSPSIGSTLDLSREDRKIIKGGNFSPVAREMLAAIRELTRAKMARAAFMGASQGGTFTVSTTAEALRTDEFDSVDGALVFGLPNVIEREHLELLSDFSKAGAAELHETLIRGGVPQLVTANYFSLQKPKRPIHFTIAATTKMARHPILGYALSGGMGKVEHVWQNDIPSILRAGTPLTLVSEGEGAIMPTAALHERVAELVANSEELGLSEDMLRKLGLVSIVDGNHTLADHIPTVASFLDRI